MNFQIKRGTNIATCKICDEIIRRNQITISAHCPNNSGQIHLKCANDIAKIELKRNSKFYRYNRDTE